jgi:hypothetical protein
MHHGTDNSDQEVTFCCLNAVLRDYARFGRLLAHDGFWEGRQLMPRQWIIDATTVRPADGYLAPGVATRYDGYGYQVWIQSGSERRFALKGVRGQYILVDPASKLVMCTPLSGKTQTIQRTPRLAPWLMRSSKNSASDEAKNLAIEQKSRRWEEIHAA